MTSPGRPRAPTLKDLAREAGVSLTSASYAINGTGSVGPKTRAHVLAVAQRIGFRLNLTARTMKSGRSGMLALVIPDLGNPFFAALVQAVFREARAAGYHIYMTNTEGSEELEADALAMAVGLRVDGLIWFSIRDKDTSRGILAATPTVVLDRTVPGYDAVTIDYYQAGRRAADCLIAHGHRQVGIISGPLDIASMRDRCTGLRDRIADVGAVVFEVENAFALDLEPGAKAAVLGRQATAIFAGADIIGVGVMRFAQRNAIDVPRDLAVIGFDDIDLASLISPALTTMEIPVEEIASRATALLLDRIAATPAGVRIEQLPARVIERESVARCMQTTEATERGPG
jgi:LacI family transcriptional regulator